MIRVGILDRSPQHRKAVITAGSVPLHRTQIIAASPDEFPGPTAILIEQGPQLTLPTHFHVNCQFQVFIRGSGFLGRRPVSAWQVQYVGAHTGYGPIVSGDEELWYLTLRPSYPAGAKYLPAARAELDLARPKRQALAAPFPAPAADAPAVTTVLIAPEPDHLAAWWVHLPPHGSLPGPLPIGGLGRYYAIVKGSVDVEGEHLRSTTLAWISGEPSPPLLVAGAAGADVIVMQFPDDAF